MRFLYKKIVGDFMANKGIKKTSYLNPKTGEYAEKRQWIDLQFDDEGYLFWNRKANVKTFLDMPLPKSFTWSERGRIHELKHYIIRDNQFLAYRSNNVIKPITANEMCKIFTMSTRQCLSLIRKMKAEKVIKEIKFDGLVWFAFNPLYGFKEKRLNLNVYLFFQDEFANVLPKWVIERYTQEANELMPKFEIIK